MSASESGQNTISNMSKTGNSEHVSAATAVVITMRLTAKAAQYLVVTVMVQGKNVITQENRNDYTF